MIGLSLLSIRSYNFLVFTFGLCRILLKLYKQRALRHLLFLLIFICPNSIEHTIQTYMVEFNSLLLFPWEVDIPKILLEKQEKL